MIFQEELLKSLQKGGTNIAIKTNEDEITYSSLIGTANNITHLLLTKELPKGTFIGILLEDRVDIIKTIIGIMNAGHVFVPLDAKLPSEKLKAIKDQLNLKHIITVSDIPKLTSFDEVDYLEVDSELTKERWYDVILPDFDEEDSLYVYFTSGSTGIPKGVIGKNSSLTQFIRWETESYQFDSTTRSSQFISPYFDAFLRDIFVPIFSGGTICIPPKRDDFFTPEIMSSWIEENNISLIHCVPSVFRIFNDSSFFSEKSYKNLKHVMLSGEKIIPSELKNWYNNFGNRIQLVNLYGTTETTMVRMFYNIQPEDADKTKISIGAPIDDTEVFILDKKLKKCKPFITGDLYICSEFMTKGYLNNEDLNNEKFVVLEGSKKAFKTGDKARQLIDGTIELLGREDRQIKLRGIRIELDEVEHILGKSELAENVIAIKHSEEINSQNPNESIVVFAKRKSILEDHTDLVEELENYATNYLPQYMIPSRIIEIEELPILNNGKLDFKELEKFLLVNKEVSIEVENPIQAKLLKIWKEILGDKIISINDNFLKSGGNSLSLMRLIAKIYSEFEIRVPLSELFKNLTIEKQASYLINCSQVDEYKIEKTETKKFYEVTAAQRRLYLQYLLNSGSIAYNLPGVVKINELQNFDKIEEVFLQLIERHESLRTNFEVIDGKVVQRIRDEVDFTMAKFQAKNISDAIEDFVQPFDLSQGPLMRVGIVQLEDKDNYLIFDIHHIICDGASQINLLKDFTALFNSIELEPLEIQCKDYAEWEQRFVTTENYTSQKNFWLDSFKNGVPQLSLSNNNENLDHGSTVMFEIKQKQLQDFVDTEKDDITKSSVLFTIFMIFLVRFTGRDRHVIGIPSSGRIQEEVNELIGMFVKTLPINYHLDRDLSFRENLHLVHSYLSKAYDNQLFDLSDIIKEINANDISETRSLFDVMFTFQNFENKTDDKILDVFIPVDFHLKSVKYPLEFIISEDKEEMIFKVEYSNEIFDDTDIELMISTFKNTFKEVLDNSDIALSDMMHDNEESLKESNEDLAFNF